MKDVLIVGNYKKNKGGIATNIDKLYKLIVKDGFDVEIFSTKRKFRLFLFFLLFRKAKNFKALHIHGCSYLGFYPIVLGVIVGKLTSKKTIVTYHGGGAKDFFRKYGFIAIPVLKRADHITTMSKYLQDIFKFYKIEPQIVPNVYEFNQLIGQRQTLNLLPLKIISTRTLDPVYNIDIIIKAFGKIVQRYPDATLNILGNGSEKKELESLVDDMSIPNIRFLGIIPNAEMIDHLLKSNIFISASSFDNQPYSILEAFQAEIPVIATKVGGVVDMITHLKNGYLVEPGHIEQIVEAVSYFMEHKIEVKNITKNAYNSLNKYSWNSIGSRLYSLYELQSEKGQ